MRFISMISRLIFFICLATIMISFIGDFIYFVIILSDAGHTNVGNSKYFQAQIIAHLIGLICKPTTIIGLFKKWNWINLFTILYLIITMLFFRLTLLLFEKSSVGVESGISSLIDFIIFHIPIIEHLILIILFIMLLIIQCIVKYFSKNVESVV